MSDLTRFATSLAERLGLSTAPVPAGGHPLWDSDDGLRDALAWASEAALLATPGSTRFDERHPSPLLLSAAATPDDAAQRTGHFFTYWERLLTRTRDALDPGEAARLDRAFTLYTESVAASLPGSWTSEPLDLNSPPAERSSPACGSPDLRRARSSPPRQPVPRHRVLIVQDSGPVQEITAATFLPARLRRVRHLPQCRLARPVQTARLPVTTAEHHPPCPTDPLPPGFWTIP